MMKYTKSHKNRTLLAFLALLALLAHSALASSPSDFELYIQSGHKDPRWNSMVKAAFESFEGNNLDTSIVFLQKAYNLGCRDGLLLFKLGLYYELGKDYSKAAQYYSGAKPKLKIQYPNYSETKRIDEHLARVYYQSNKFPEALTHVTEALKTKPENFMLLFMAGQIYRGQKKTGLALEYFHKAIAANIPPELGPQAKKSLLTELMSLNFELKKYDTSLKYAEEILKTYPTDPTAISYRDAIQKEKYRQREQEAIKKIIQ